MWVTRSAAGLVLCALYLLYAAVCVVADLTRRPSPLILPDMTMLVALPGLVVVVGVAQLFGVEMSEDNRLLFYVPAVLITAALFYLFGATAGWLLEAAVRTFSPGGAP